MKQCQKCNTVKILDDFPKDKLCKDGHRNICLICKKEAHRQYHQKHRESLLKRMSEYREKNKDILYAKQRECRKRKSEQYKKMRAIHYLNHKEEILEKVKIYRQEKKKEIAIKDRIRKNIYRKNSIQFKLKETLRGRFFRCLKNGLHKKSAKTLEILGCSIPFLIKYLENQFKDGMSWENYGRKGWHIDHIKPCSSFDLSLPEEQQKCFHYSNLQPLWAIDNLKKGDKF